MCFFGCNQPTDNTVSQSTMSEVVPLDQDEFNDSSQIQGVDIGYRNLKLIGKLERKTRSATEKELGTTGCKDWVFKEVDLRGLLKKMERVEPVKWNMVCYDYPCYYEGAVGNGKDKYTITINGASYIELHNEKETVIFIYTQKTKLFLIPCNCCE